MPALAILKIGAFGSELTATIFAEPCMPTRCWTAPETPMATIEIRRYGLPCLTNLPLIRHQTCFYNRPRAGHNTSYQIGKLLKHRHGIRVTGAFPGDYERGKPCNVKSVRVSSFSDKVDNLRESALRRHVWIWIYSACPCTVFRGSLKTFGRTVLI